MTYLIPPGFIVTGTCGHCGGPVITSQVVPSTGSGPIVPYEFCQYCNKTAAPDNPSYGPIRRMKEAKP